MLVNNAGVMYPSHFVEKTPEEIFKTIEINLTPYAMLTQLLLPKMYERDSRSAIITVSSV